MVKLNYNILRFLLFLFLLIQALTFVTRQNMQQMLIFDYSFVLSVVFVFSISKSNQRNPIKFFYLTSLAIISFVLYMFGFAGSISGNILAASIPFFIFNHIDSSKKLISILYNPIKWGTIAIIIFGTFLFFDVHNQLTNFALLTKYFIKASINYVSLMFYGCAMLYLLIYNIKKRVSSVSKFDYLLAIIILGTSTFYSAMYLTRSTFVASIIMSIIFFRANKIFLFISFMIAIVMFRMEIIEYFVSFLGSDSIGDLAVQDVRVESINYLVSNAIDFNYDFSNTMSHSSLINLLFCLFPFTLFFGVDLVITAIGIIKIKVMELQVYYAILFFTAVFVCTYQMDFFSIFTLFMCGQFIIFESRSYGNNVLELD